VGDDDDAIRLGPRQRDDRARHRRRRVRPRRRAGEIVVLEPAGRRARSGSPPATPPCACSS
jgi:hypothetical protein